MPEAVGAIAARTVPAVAALHAHVASAMLGGRGIGGVAWGGTTTGPQILVPETGSTALGTG